MRLDLTTDDIHVLLIGLDTAIEETQNPILKAVAALMKSKLESLLQQDRAEKFHPFRIRKHGDIARLVRAAVSEMPAQFSMRDVLNHLERCGYPQEGGPVYQVLKRMPQLEVELVGRGKRCSKYRKKNLTSPQDQLVSSSS